MISIRYFCSISYGVTLLLICFGFGLWPQVTNAATIPVDTTAYGVVADGECSLVEAILAANTNTASNGCPAGDDSPMDTLVLEAHVTYTLPTSYATYLGPTGLPSIASTIIISGNGAIIERNSANHLRLMHVATSGDLTLRDVTLRNGSVTVEDGLVLDGGAIANWGTLTVIDSRILSNTAGASGGAISNQDHAKVVLVDTDLHFNTAQVGGGIYNGFFSTATLTDSQIGFNTATVRGGGMSNESNSTLLVTGTYIISNTAPYAGGGIFNGYSTMLSVTNTHILSNLGGSGGGIDNYANCIVYLTGSNVTSNQADNGGGIYNDTQCTTTVIDSYIALNTAEMNGGGLYATHNTTSILTDTHILSNTAVSSGGGIYNHGSLTITSTDIIANSASVGAGFHAGGVPLYISHSRLLDNISLLEEGALTIAGVRGWINDSCIVGNSPIGLAFWPSYPDEVFDARYNWWGEPDGPSGMGLGEGDSVNNEVTFHPYLDAAILGCPTKSLTTKFYLPHLRH